MEENCDGVVKKPLNVDYFDKLEYPEAWIYACVCIMGLKVNQKFTTNQIITVNEEHGFTKMSINEMKEYILEYGPTFLRKN